MNKTTLAILGAILIVGFFAYDSFGNPPDARWYDILTGVIYIGGTWLIWRHSKSQK